MAKPHDTGTERTLDDLRWIVAPDPGERYENVFLGPDAERQACYKSVHDGQLRLGLFHAPGEPRTIRRILCSYCLSGTHRFSSIWKSQASSAG